MQHLVVHLPEIRLGHEGRVFNRAELSLSLAPLRRARMAPKEVPAVLSNYRGVKVSSVPERAIPDVLVRLAPAAASVGRMLHQWGDADPVHLQLAEALDQLRRPWAPRFTIQPFSVWSDWVEESLPRGSDISGGAWTVGFREGLRLVTPGPRGAGASPCRVPATGASSLTSTSRRARTGRGQRGGAGLRGKQVRRPSCWIASRSA
jgi:hypothetical protein